MFLIVWLTQYLLPGLSTYENCLAWETKKLVFYTYQPSNCAVLTYRKSDKHITNKGYAQFFFLDLLTCIRMWEILYVLQLFMGEMFVMQEILYAWRETPSQCRRVDSPAVSLSQVPPGGVTLHMTGYAPAYTKSIEKGSFLTYNFVDVFCKKGIFSLLIAL